MGYTPLFKPDPEAVRTDGGVAYLYEPGIELAVNVALATGRPLLLRGVPGSGKSTLASDVAWRRGWRYEPSVVTSRTQAQDLQWRFDAVRRLADAYGAEAARARAGDPANYLDPGVLWLAFEPNVAALGAADRAARLRADPSAEKPKDVVVLLDEIDKADPDVPNDLLMLLDQGWFEVAEVGRKVKRHPQMGMLMVITTNGERDLPAAFVRRCVAYDIPPMSRAWMKKIVHRHHPGFDDELLDAILTLLGELQKRAEDAKVRAPSVAEVIDAVRACVRTDIREASDPQWEKVATAALWKHPEEQKSAP